MAAAQSETQYVRQQAEAAVADVSATAQQLLSAKADETQKLLQQERLQTAAQSEAARHAIAAER